MHFNLKLTILLLLHKRLMLSTCESLVADDLMFSPQEVLFDCKTTVKTGAGQPSLRNAMGKFPT